MLTVTPSDFTLASASGPTALLDWATTAGNGQQVLDPVSREAIVKATKCDLCSSLPSGPACERACPHDALKRVDIQSLIRRAAQLEA